VLLVFLCPLLGQVTADMLAMIVDISFHSYKRFVMRSQVFMQLETLSNLSENRRQQSSRTNADVKALTVLSARKCYCNESNTGHAAESFPVPHDAT
jgi:hypothetical protein